MTAHWGVPDPASVTGSEEAINKAFRDAAMVLRKRIELFISLPASAIDRLSMKAHLDQIGKAY